MDASEPLVARRSKDSAVPDELTKIRAVLDEGFVEMRQGFAAVRERFAAVEQRFDAVDRRFDAVDLRFDAVDRRFEVFERRFDDLKRHVTIMVEDVRDDIRIVAEGYGAMNTRVDRLADAVERAGLK